MIFGMDIRTCAITYLQLVRKNVHLSFQNCSMGISILFTTVSGIVVISGLIMCFVLVLNVSDLIYTHKLCRLRKIILWVAKTTLAHGSLACVN